MDVIKILKSLPNHRKPWSSWLDFPNQYNYYFKLIQELNPNSILEIGACLGYFLSTAILAKNNLNKIYWIDNESYEKNSNYLAKQNIEYIKKDTNSNCELDYINKYPNISFIEQNKEKYDLIHIDGDHSFGGCLFDLFYSFNLKPKIIIGHDIKLEKEVAEAVSRFCDYYELKFEILDDFNHGLYIIKL